MGLKKQDCEELKNLRQEFLDYVYDKYVYTALLQVMHSENERYVMAIEKSYEDSTILDEYLMQLHAENQEFVSLWKNGIYDDFHLFAFDDKVWLYQENKEDVYEVLPLDETIHTICRNAPAEMLFKVSLVPFKGQFVIDAIEMLPNYDSSMEHLEKLYEDRRKYSFGSGVLIYPHTYKKVELLKRDSNTLLQDAFLDFIAPFDMHILESDELQQLCSIGVLAWNASILPESKAEDNIKEEDMELFNLLKKRKTKLYPDHKIRISSYEIKHNNGNISIQIEGVGVA